MKLLLDENLSDRIIPRIVEFYPESAHVKASGLTASDDAAIWAFAGQRGFTIVSKDADFHQRSLMRGAPPKFIFLRSGICPTSDIIHRLRSNLALISGFDADPDAAILILS